MADRRRQPRVGLAVDGTDHFFRPIERALHDHYDINRFSPRFIKAPVVGTSVNKLLFEVEFRRFLASHDIVFFDWAGSLLVRTTHLPKRCRIITRLHSIEVATAAHLVDWSQVDAAIVVSERMKQRLLQVANAPPPRLEVINYGVDLERFRPVPKSFRYRIGMVARVVPIKRVYEAVLTIYELRRRGHPFTLAVAGPLGDDLEPRYPWAIRELLERLDLTEHISLLGPVSDPASFFSEIDIFLSNSFWEGQQNALLEAMACGCYCLSHWWGGVEEVLPTEDIYITDSDLRAKLIAYAALPEAAQRAAQAHMRAIAEERFDERRMVREIVDLIEQVAGTSSQTGTRLRKLSP